jgi:hypothetical protein
MCRCGYPYRPSAADGEGVQSRRHRPLGTIEHRRIVDELELLVRRGAERVQLERDLFGLDRRV